MQIVNRWSAGGRAALWIAVTLAVPAAAELREEPLTPAEAVEAFELSPGLTIELVACEPQVVDPVAIRFDARGRIWVVEMGDYPTPPSASAGEPGTHRGRIKILSDRDGDGFFEQAEVFADNLLFPTGLQLFDNGAIVTLADKIVFMETTRDREGGLNGVVQQTSWFTGFADGNEQLRANHPTLTIENQVHVATGLRGGTVQSINPKWPAEKQPISLSQRDFEFDPRGGNWQPAAGNSQFGFHQDAAARRYVCSNRNPCELLMADASQVQANPLLPIAQWRVSVMPAAEQSRVFPLVDAWTTSNLHAGQFTAACGVYRYESDLLEAELGGSFFACEPTGSLVQRYRTVESGLVPVTQRGEAGREFLACRDPWFRPVSLNDGPDGGLYVVDMHRAVIEHPDWMPVELRSRADLRWGNQAGRIYRIVPADSARSEAQRSDDLSAATDQKLVVELGSSNRWRRMSAGRLLFERAGQRDAEDHGQLALALRDQWLCGEGLGNRHGPIRSLWLLQAMRLLTPDDLASAAGADSPDLRRQVVRLLGEVETAGDGQISLLRRRLAGDADPRVRYQWLLEYAAAADEAAIDSLAVAARFQPTDTATDREWLAKAVSLVPQQLAAPLTTRLFAEATEREAETIAICLPLWRRCGWQGDVAVLLAALSAIESEAGKQAAWESFSAGVTAANRSWQQLLNGRPAGESVLVRSLIERDRSLAADQEATTARRLAAWERLQNDRSTETLTMCRDVIERRETRFWRPAVEGLRRLGNAADAARLTACLAELPPTAFADTIRVLLQHRSWTPTLIAAVASQQIPAGLIDAGSWQRLLQHPDGDVAAQARELHAAGSLASDSKLWERYHAALANPGDLATGKLLFAKHCAACHRLDGTGAAVGPDISDLRTKPPEQVLTAILDPNRAIDAAYFRYIVLTTDGQAFEGLLEEGQGDSVTLLMQQLKRKTIPRDQIEDCQASGVSLMPAGFERQLSPQAMCDLIAYVKGWRYLKTEIPQRDLPGGS